jgi:tripartite ATP-independent transporter DctM subunit
VAEITILLVGVISRYVFLAPVTWSDELAEMLFLWLAMLGAVVAYIRFSHMRMALFSSTKNLRLHGLLEALSLVSGIVLCACLLSPAIDHALDEIVDITPALEVPNAWATAALPIGFGLMLVIGLLRIGRVARWSDVFLAFVLIAAIGGALGACQPLLYSMGNYRLIIFFVLLVGGAVLSGIPIAFAFGLGTFANLFWMTRGPMSVMVDRFEEGMSHIVLLSVPLFIFLGFLIEITGMARTMVDFLGSLIGHVRGGLQYVLVGAMYLVSGISGSKSADMAAVAPVLFPEMQKRGAQPGDLVALLAATGAQTETIPPSLVLITIGSVTGVSISALFKGGLMPGIVLAIVLCIVVWWRYRTEDLTHVRKASWAQSGRALLVALPAVLLPFIIRTAVLEGVATATEVSTIGIAYILLYGVVAALAFRQRIAWGRLWPALIGTAALSGTILFIIGAATSMAWALTQSGFARALAVSIVGLPGGKAAFMAMSMLMFIVLGSVLEGIPAIVLFGPMLFPAARLIGINEVHYAVVVILSMGVGLFSPPFGVGYYSACAIGGINPTAGIRAIIPYLVALLIGLVLIAAVPMITTGFL